MSDNKLNVEIGATVSDLNKGIDKAVKEIRRLEMSQDDLNKSFRDGAISEKNYISQTAKLNTSLRAYKNTVKGATSQQNKLVKGTVRGAVPAMTSFSQVIQDAPFGIRGVANNITQLTMQMGHLSKNAGGTVPALKSMLATLAGPAGILLAVSAVTSIWVSYEKEIKKVLFGSDELVDKQKELAESLEKYKEGLDNISRSQLKGSENAVKQTTKLGLLRAQIENTTISTEKRQMAIDEIRSIYPKYFGNITDENLLLGKAETAYNNLTEAILKNAKARAAEQLIVKLQKQSLIIQQQSRDAADELTKKKVEQVKAEKTALDLISKNQRGQETAASIAISLGNEVNDILDDQAERVRQINVIQKQVLGLANDINNAGGILGDLGGKGIDKDTGITTGTKGGGAKDAIKEFSFFSDEILKTQQKGQIFEDPFGFKAQQGTIKETLAGTAEIVKSGSGNIVNQATDLKDQLNSIITLQLTKIFSDLGESIANSFGNGENEIKSGGAKVLGAFGSILQQYGSLVLATGVASTAFKEAITKPFGGGIGAVIAGAALIAIGGAVKKFSSNLASKGSSGGSTASSGVGGGSSQSFSGSRVGGGSTGGGGGTFVFEIAGTKLIGVLQNTLARNKALGGGNLAFLNTGL